MGKYLKMADVFSMGVVQEDSFLVSKDGEDLACFICYLDEDRDLMAKYASHAINSHDELVTEVGRLRQVMQRCCDALYIADKFCGNHTADECDDSIAIPISDALVEAAKELAK